MKKVKKLTALPISVNLEVEICRILYEKDKNPWYLWHALGLYNLLKEGGLINEELPQWIISYLSDCACDLSTLEDEEKASDAKVLNALKFKKKKNYARTFFTEHKKNWDYLPAMIDCYILAEKGDRKNLEIKRMADIFSLVGSERNLDEAVINKHYYRFKNIISELVLNNKEFYSHLISGVKESYPSCIRS